MTDVASLEFEYCRESVMLPGSLFEFTSRYLPDNRLDSLLSLYALIQAIASIPYSPVDDSVKWAKLKWWSEEIVAAPDSSSRHPVLRALWLSGARVFLSNAVLLRLISDAVQQIDIAPDSDESAMFDRIAALGATEILLELSLDSAEIDTQSLELLGAATRLFRMVSSFAGRHKTETEHLPLSVLAKYNVSTEQLEQTVYPGELKQIIGELAGQGLDWYAKGISSLNISPESGLGSHLQLRWAMEIRCLSEANKNPAGFLNAGKKYGPADAWFAWRFLRQLK